MCVSVFAFVECGHVCACVCVRCVCMCLCALCVHVCELSVYVCACVIV